MFRTHDSCSCVTQQISFLFILDLEICVNAGRRKAKVLPDPVCPMPTMLLPSIAIGNAYKKQIAFIFINTPILF